MTNPIDAAIEAAKQQAAVATAGVPATTQPQATAVAPIKAGPLTLDDLTQGGMNVNDWLKVTEFGLLVASHTDKLFSFAEFRLDTSKVQACEVIKFGNPATYLKTYDRVVCTAGGTWQEALNRAAQVQPGVRPYQSADLPLEVIGDLKSMDGTLLAKDGDILGHSTSTTNYKNLSALMRELKEKKQLGAVIKVKVGYEKRTNVAKNTWGILTFELLEILEEVA